MYGYVVLIQVSLFSTTAHEQTTEMDIRKFIDVFQSNKLIVQHDGSSRGLINFMTGTLVAPELAHDLLSARSTGQKDYEIAVQYYFFKTPSLQFKRTKRKLLTFANTTKKKRKQPLALIEQKRITFCTKRAIAWAKDQNKNADCIGMQFIEQPRALVDTNNKPTKGQKSNLTQHLVARYPTVITQNLPEGWTPEVVILDGMFLLHVKPFGNGSTFKNYAMLLLRRFVQTHFKQGVNEVHIIFDKTSQTDFNPKQWEQQERDASRDKDATTTHVHVQTISDEVTVPSNWKGFIACRTCKTSLTTYLSLKLLALSPGVMTCNDQKVITAGPLKTMSYTISKMFQQEEKYTSDATEADSRIWRHCQQSDYTKHYVFSPDTDTYVIGLTNYKEGSETYIDLTTIGSDETKILNLNNLIDCFQRDPYLANIDEQRLTTIFQSLYVSTGCDYNPFFVGIGKGSFLKAFFMFPEFMCIEGSLSDVDERNKEQGYLAFLRLVGTAYFLMHRASYRGNKSPVNLYHSCDLTPAADKHIMWVDKIREHVWEQTQDEKYLLPSHTALKMQWLRTVWVLHAWKQAGTTHAIKLLTPEQHGWTKEQQGYSFKWDTAENVMAVRNRVSKLTNGCKCLKNNCKTKQCGCKKKGQICGPGCQCLHCENLCSTIDISTTSPETELYFEDDSIQIGEEIEVREDFDEIGSDSDSSSTTDNYNDDI